MTHGERVRHCADAQLKLELWLIEWRDQHDLMPAEQVDILLEIATTKNNYSMRLERYGDYEKPHWDQDLKE